MEDNQQGNRPETPPSSTPPPETPPPASAPPPETPPITPAPAVSSNRTIMLILSYLFILALIPLLTEKEDQEVQWHAKHGLVLSAAWIIISIASMVLQVIPVIGTVLGCVLSLAMLIGVPVITIICIIKAVNGERFRLPVISDFADQWK